jgi:hypothetical protein
LGKIRIFYTDLDGTMVGPGGCFFRDGQRALTLAPARALVALLDAGITLVLVSGRTGEQLLEATRVFGADGYIGELGAVIGWDAGRQSQVLRGAQPADLPGPAGPQAHRLGVVEGLLERYRGRLEYHSPWHIGHEADVMLRGLVDPAEVDAHLAASGFGWLRLHDNGVLVHHPGETLDAGSLPPHVYHLLPAGLSKGAAVAADLARRGLDPAEAVAAGDSSSDLSMAPQVGRMFLVGGRVAVPAGLGNVTVTDPAVGSGWVRAARYAARRGPGALR